jgi:hypothetical protein
MVHFDDAWFQMLCGIIHLMLQCRDAGLRRRGEPLVEPEGLCDLCSARPEVGRLLEGDFGIGHDVHPNGSVSFRPWRVEDPVDGRFWLCLPCYRLLCSDPPALLRRLLAKDEPPRN